MRTPNPSARKRKRNGKEPAYSTAARMSLMGASAPQIAYMLGRTTEQIYALLAYARHRGIETGVLACETVISPSEYPRLITPAFERGITTSALIHQLLSILEQEPTLVANLLEEL